MSKRSYTHVQELLPTIQAMVDEGKTHRQIAVFWVQKQRSRKTKRERSEQIQSIPKQRGRKPAKTLIDKKIRDLTDDMYLLTKSFRTFSYAKRILRKTVLVEATGDGPSRIDENLVFDSLLFFWCGSRKFTYIPKYAKYFDSFSPSVLPTKQFELVPGWELPDHKILRLMNRKK